MPYSDNLSCKLSLQILSAICLARPERLQESVLGAPLGISRLVGVLDNVRDDVRYAGLELLTHLTGGANEDLRKIVAFEDVFSKVFALIKLEGGLAEAGIVAQDCLALLVNLVKGSNSNQGEPRDQSDLDRDADSYVAMFRESGCVTHLTECLREIFPPAETEAAFLKDNRIRAGWGVLQLLRQLLVLGEASTFQNQTVFFRTGTAQILMDLAFNADLPSIIRVTAFRAGSDLVQNNAPIQVNFATIQVELSAPKAETQQSNHLQVNGTKSATTSARNSARPSLERHRTYIIEALLELVLREQRSPHELRVAACTVIQAYLVKHNEIRAHFLQRATAGYKEREKAPNVLSSLLRHNDDSTGVVLAAWTVQDLVASNRDAKAAFAAVQEIGTDEDEDVLSAVQTLGNELQQRIQQGAELQQIAAYATTLTVLLWDFADGINLLLAEGSSLLQTLIEAARSDDVIIAGLTAALLGIIYEFSTKDSPIPRTTLSTLLQQKLARDTYLSALTGMRKDPCIRDYDLPVDETQRLELSESYFNLFLNEYPRLRRAIDKDPGIEVLPYAAAEAGVQRDILDELRSKIEALEQTLSQSQQEAAESSQQAQQDKMQSEQRFLALQKDGDHEKVELQKELHSAALEAERMRAVISKMQNAQEDALRQAEKQRITAAEENNIKHARELASVRQEADRRAQQAKQSAEQGFVPVRQDFERRLAELGNSHRTEQAGHNEARKQLEALQSKSTEADEVADDLRRELQAVKQRQEESEKSQQQAIARAENAEAELQSIKQAHEAKTAQVNALSDTVAELKAELSGKEQELATERTGFAELEKELETAKKQADKAVPAGKGNKKDADAAKKADQLKTLSDSLAKEVKQLKADTEKAAIREAELQDKNTASVKTAQIASEAEKSAKEELNDLLLVLGELEGKRDEYKTKVKALGGEVTDDEDDSQGEDNDDVD